MQNTSTFKVYNASAGSGKTFTLVKEYLKVLLKTENIFAFQKVLAITFTNKAAAEMKERVLKSLEDFSEKRDSDLLQMLSEELGIETSLIQKRSTKILQAILQNYAGFYITTIDSFTYKIIKSFSFDLGLSQNFEVEMNPTELLHQAVESLISKIGVDEELTSLLIAYSLDKTEDDKSWDISRELNEFSKILLHENDIPHFQNLRDKSLADFTELKKKVSLAFNESVEQLKSIGQEGVNTIAVMGLEKGDFYRGTLPKFFSDLSNLNTKFDYLKRSATIEKAIENHQFYSKTVSQDVQTGIENIIPELTRLFQESQEVYKKLVLYKLTLKSIVPLAVLNQIHEELQYIKEENNLQLNAEFNQLISENIKEQPAPYIYERIGQKFNYYFVDEMQDTSVLQWQNLLPLIENSLAQEDTGLLLVGDGKQAIYRWRGGRAEQFINLGSVEQEDQNPFYISKEVKELAFNYRSYSEVIHFNNSFFKHCASYLQNELYQELFLNKSFQKENAKKGGYVQVSFLEKQEDKEENDLKYAKKVAAILENLEDGFLFSDVCILVRRKKDGIVIANYLSERGIEIVSSETLLLQNSLKVIFMIDVLKYVANPKDDDALFEMLYFLSDHLNISEGKHLFLSGLAQKNQEAVFEELQKYNIHFEREFFNQLALYEKIEYIIKKFSLLDTSDAYVQFFLDEVLVQQKKDVSIQGFLDFWEREKEQMSIVASANSNAVQIMTIHKSKGLEFPVVIFPCDLDIYRQIQPKVWLDDLPQETFNNFDELLIPFGKEVELLSESGRKLYKREREKLELDNLNLLYVALTRAEEQLYIITEEVLEKNIGGSTKYSDFFVNYLTEESLFDVEKKEYYFGEITAKSERKQDETDLVYQEQYISTPWQDHNIHMLASSSALWGSLQGDAIDYGNLIHEMMAKIHHVEEVDAVIQRYRMQGVFNEEESQNIQQRIDELVHHKNVAPYFLPDLTVYNEREIVTTDRQIIIPDRLVVYPNKEVVVIDYKTGKPSGSHHQQLKKYAIVLQELGYVVIKKILIYMNEKIVVEEI